MTAAATTRELWDAYQDAGEDVVFWRYRASEGDSPAIRQLIFALFQQYLALQQLLGIDAQKGDTKCHTS